MKETPSRLPLLRRLKISNSFDKKANFVPTFAVLQQTCVSLDNNPEKVSIDIDIYRLEDASRSWSRFEF